MNKTINFSPQKIVTYFDRFVVGQEEAKKDLAMLGFLQQVRLMMSDKKLDKDVTAGWKKPLTGMIVGPTGCGKTYLIKLLAKYINVPLISINARELTNTGYVGKTFPDLVRIGMQNISSKDFPYDVIEDASQRAVIFIDEFDKICNGLNSDGWSRSIQNSLLVPIEGGFIGGGNREDGKRIDTSKMIFILGGSFSHLSDKRTRESKAYGFDKTLAPAVLDKISQAELIEAGVARELAGRIHCVTQVYPLTKQEMYEALTTAEASVLRDYDQLMEFLGQPPVTKEEIDVILETAFAENSKKDNNLGARALINAANTTLRDRLKNATYQHIISTEPEPTNGGNTDAPNT